MDAFEQQARARLARVFTSTSRPSAIAIAALLGIAAAGLTLKAEALDLIKIPDHISFTLYPISH